MPAPPAREGRDAGAAGPQLLGQRALGGEFQLQFTREKLALELLVFPHVGTDHLLDLARLQELAQAEPVHPGVVRDDGEVLHPAVAQRIDQRLWNTAQPEAADGQQLAILHEACEGLGCGSKYLVHASLLFAGMPYDTTY